MCNVVPAAGKKIVDTKYFATILNEAIAKMRAEKSGAASNEYAIDDAWVHDV
jgi:hypothetical protein